MMRLTLTYSATLAVVMAALLFCVNARAALPSGSLVESGRLSLRAVRLADRFGDTTLDRDGASLTSGERLVAERYEIATERVSVFLKGFQRPQRIALSVDAAGMATSCRTIIESDLGGDDALACQLLLARRDYAPVFVAPRQPIVATAIFEVTWMLASQISGGGKWVGGSVQPGPWPRTTWSNHVVLESYPNVDSYRPTNLVIPAAGAVTTLDLIISAKAGMTGCATGVSSGIAELDQAACRVAADLKPRYAAPCSQCDLGPVPLKIVWDSKKSYLVFPRGGRPHDQARGKRVQHDSIDPMLSMPCKSPCAPVVVWRGNRPPSPQEFPPLEVAPLADVALKIGFDSRGQPLTCEVARGSGNSVIDRRACKLVEQRATFLPARDVFDDPMQSVAAVTIGWGKTPSFSDRFRAARQPAEKQ